MSLFISQQHAAHFRALAITLKLLFQATTEQTEKQFFQTTLFFQSKEQDGRSSHFEETRLNGLGLTTFSKLIYSKVIEESSRK